MAEDDESYRYRINLKLQSKGGSAEGDLRLAVLQIPGVQDVEFEREAGTYNAYVYGVAPNVPASLLQLVQEQLDQRTAYPLVGRAIAYLDSPSCRSKKSSRAQAGEDSKWHGFSEAGREILTHQNPPREVEKQVCYRIYWWLRT